ncbi:glycosyl hydrolase 53 family protein [Amphibacillus sp. MSJ-3]|uniref:glycoside hydrolase family 53 protein n=1 Tax=Amphibacillus sp. MSJ-3 TaxID=2841505 RepID=UPI001C0E8F91|nr:glycosyl hydrolase 53 family protein [Amphibacillus sp. MSJ-3]MBU5594086.1 glycosyl hydrolase 53 family protein [Amphibacillus sp. MSJ-3]
MKPFVKGADVSSLKEIESFGGNYYLDGKKKDLFDILKLKGINTIRLRLWVDPYDENGHPYLGGTNDLATTVELAKRIKKAGLDFMLNLHYSDFWADPKKQTKPKSWTHLFGKALVEQVYQYTRDTLNYFDELDLMPKYIQIGNETTNGMLFPDGRIAKYLFEERQFEELDNETKEKSFDRLNELLSAGIKATREIRSADELKIIIHLDFGGANDLYRGWFDQATDRKLDFDIIGLSYYPYWHNCLDDLSYNLKDIMTRYKKDTMIVETAYAFTDQTPKGEDSIFNIELSDKAGYPPTVNGQKEFLHDLMQVVKDVEQDDNYCLGIVYWEPAWLPVKGTSWASIEGMKYGNDLSKSGNHWANQALFDFDGHALDSLNVFKCK